MGFVVFLMDHRQRGRGILSKLLYTATTEYEFPIPTITLIAGAESLDVKHASSTVYVPQICLLIFN